MPPIDWPDLAEIPHGCAKPLCRNGFSLLFPAPDQARLVRAFSVGDVEEHWKVRVSLHWTGSHC